MAFPFKSITTVGGTEAHPDTANNGAAVKVPDPDPDPVSSSSRETTTTTTDAVVLAPGLKKRFLLIDETKLPKEEAERLLIKRAYNRECAERARKRSKETVKELYRQVDELQADKNELRRTLTTMEKEIHRLKETNKALMLNQITQGGDDMYSHLNLGMCTKTLLSPLHWYSTQHPITTVSMLSSLSSSGNDDALSPLQPPSIGSPLLPSWDCKKLALLQQTRK
jgi:hypothetical protein